MDGLIQELDPSDSIRLSCGNGSKGLRVYDWTRSRLNDPVTGWERRTLRRRSVAEPEDLAYHLVFVPSNTPLAEMVRVAGGRWRIKEAIAEAKGEVGLDHYEVGSWRGWYRHLTLAMLAHAYFVVTRSTVIAPEGANGGGVSGRREQAGRMPAPAAGDGLIRPSMGEIRHLVWRVVQAVKPIIAAVLGWSVWRRRHQARARTCHFTRRFHDLGQHLQL